MFNVPLVVDPSNEIAEVLVEALEWNMLSREWNMSVSYFQELHNERNSSANFLSFHLYYSTLLFTRSTPGCGILDGPSLAWAASPWPKLRRAKGSLGLRLPNERGQLNGARK
jgi:hypothetical protein